MHQPVNSPTRPFVPFVLNGRVWRFHFAPWDNNKCLSQVCVEIPMKYYPKKDGKWIVQQVFVTFVKTEVVIKNIIQRPLNAQSGKIILLANPEETTTVTEIRYVCSCNKMYYDKLNMPTVRDIK